MPCWSEDEERGESINPLWKTANELWNGEYNAKESKENLKVRDVQEEV